MPILGYPERVGLSGLLPCIVLGSEPKDSSKIQFSILISLFLPFYFFLKILLLVFFACCFIHLLIYLGIQRVCVRHSPRSPTWLVRWVLYGAGPALHGQAVLTSSGTELNITMLVHQMSKWGVSPPPCPNASTSLAFCSHLIQVPSRRNTCLLFVFAIMPRSLLFERRLGIMG